jgi:hypothetical protein
MSITLHRFSGMMDTDSPDAVVPKGVHRTGRNGIFRGNPGNYRYEAIPGTTERPNPFLPNTGTNKNIGRHYDPVNQQLYSFNWNSTGFHGIYIYGTLTKGWQILIQTGTNTIGDPLNFTAAGRIHSIDILYGDGTSGNLLFFVDSLKRPRKLNIQRLLSGVYVGIKDEYLKVIKAPLIGTPKCVYENDTTVSTNNVINALFNFAVTAIYDDFEESVLGSAGKQPLPSDPFDPTSNVDKSRNSRIAIYIPTGDQNVKKLRIYGKQTKDGATSDWFIVDTLIKADLGIADNTVYRYLFFNNGNPIPANVAFTVLDQDYVPQQANTEALINGSVITYGGITEGYDFENPSFGILTQNTNQPLYNASGTLFFAAPNGVFTGSQPQITVYLTGVGTNDGFGNPVTLEKSPIDLFVRAKSGVTNINFSYNNFSSSNSIPFLLGALQTAAVAAGWTFVSSTSNSITIYYPTGNVVLQSSRVEGFINASLYQAPVSAFYPESAVSFGVLYRDGDGRTNGTISNVTGNIKMQIQGTVGQIPEVLIGLGGFTPPTWAVYYEIVRTDNLTYQKYLDWVSGSAYSNNGTLINTPYAYFGISNISDYNISIKATEGVIGYTFTSGDRIRVLGRYDSAGSFVSLNYDYAILGVTTNPLANGQIQQGSFLQIYYPTNDINPNYKFDGSVDFQNYKILIYNYKAYNPSNQNVYWQIGEQYGIGNPGTVSAYHMGNVGDNQVNLTEGDIFYRTRTIPLTNTYYVNCGAFDQGTTYSTEWVNPGGGGTPVVDNGIWSIIGDINRNAGLLGTQYPNYGDLAWTIWNKSGSAFNVRLRQEITVVDKVDPNGQWGLYVKVIEPGNIVSLYNVIPTKSGLQPGVSNTYSFDVTLSMPGPSKLWIISYAVNEMLIGLGTLTIDIIRSRTIQVFDSSFSDIYALRTNSDNKSNVIDVTAKRTYFSTLFRFSQPDELGTEINNSNRFYFNNFDEFDKAFGDIIRMRVRQRELRIFQYRRCGRVGIYQKFISGNAGNNQLITTDTIITPNNIQYFEGEYGIGNQPDSLCSSGYDDYFSDPVKGFWCRLSLNGIVPISELYKVQTFAGNNLPNYLNNYNNQYGGSSVILGVFNFCKDRDGEAIFVLQAGFTHSISFDGPDGSTITQPAIFNTGQPSTVVGESIAFNERQNSWTDLYDFAPDSIVCCEDTLFSFVNGVLYSHDNETAYANFYGTQYPCSITLPINDNLIEKKTFLALTEVSNVPWACPLIYTDLMSYPGQRQESNLVVQDFTLLENQYNSSFWRDIFSQNGQFNGDSLKGSLIVIQFQVDNPSNGVYLTDVSITYIESKRNNR